MRGRRFLPGAALGACTVVFALCAAAAPPVLLESDELNGSELTSSSSSGWAVAIDGNTLVVGMRFGDSAHVFERDAADPTRWNEVKVLEAADGEVNNAYGQAVAISGDTLAIGAPDDSDGCSPEPCSAGAVYLYERDQGGLGNWGEIKKIQALGPTANAAFGSSLALDGDTLAVGAPGDDENGQGMGAVFLFERSLVGPLWGQARKLRASDAEAGGELGGSLALDGDTLLVGATGGTAGGAGYIFGRDRDGVESWGETEKIVRATVDGTVGFGEAVSLAGDLAFIGSPRDDQACMPGHDCNAGAVHVFDRNTDGAESWGEVLVLTPTDPTTDGRFGGALSASPGSLLIGAPMGHHDGLRSGAAYLFLQGEGGPDDWSESAKLLSSDRQDGDSLGFAVALEGATAVLGAPDHPEICCSSGAAYTFELLSTPIVLFEDGFESGDTTAWSAAVPGNVP